MGFVTTSNKRGMETLRNVLSCYGTDPVVRIDAKEPGCDSALNAFSSMICETGDWYCYRSLS